MALRINDTAPDFTADTSDGEISFHEWMGDNYAIIFSHPKDFTPVCTTEFGAVAQLAPEWEKRGVKVLGVSVDSADEHRKWKRDIEAVARAPLWQAGMDFDHGTGHGVGSYLSVHEGPARISKLGTTPLKRGMILSNEPGYYKTDAYGIRIENLELVIGTDIAGAEKPVNAFETLTLAPIDRRLIEVSMLSEGELNWLNDYHARVARTVRPHLDDNATKLWLDEATAPLR